MTTNFPELVKRGSQQAVRGISIMVRAIRKLQVEILFKVNVVDNLQFMFSGSFKIILLKKQLY